MRIEDDGDGIPPQFRAGVGILSMRERAEELGGRCTIRSSASGGTLVTVELPSTNTAGSVRPATVSPEG